MVQHVGHARQLNPFVIRNKTETMNGSVEVDFIVEKIDALLSKVKVDACGSRSQQALWFTARPARIGVGNDHVRGFALTFDPRRDQPVLTVINEDFHDRVRGVVSNGVLETPGRRGVGSVRVHQSDAFHARHIISVFLVEKVKVLFTKADPQRLGIGRPYVDVGKHGDRGGPGCSTVGGWRRDDEQRGDVLPRTAG